MPHPETPGGRGRGSVWIGLVERVDVRTDGRVDGWMDGWMDR